MFVAPLPCTGEGLDGSLSANLLRAVTDRDLPRLLLLLAHSSKEEINTPVDVAMHPGNSATQQPRPALHVACQLADVVMTQLLVWVRAVFTTLLWPLNTSDVGGRKKQNVDVAEAHCVVSWYELCRRNKVKV